MKEKPDSWTVQDRKRVLGLTENQATEKVTCKTKSAYHFRKRSFQAVSQATRKCFSMINLNQNKQPVQISVWFPIACALHTSWCKSGTFQSHTQNLRTPWSADGRQVTLWRNGNLEPPFLIPTFLSRERHWGTTIFHLRNLGFYSNRLTPLTRLSHGRKTYPKRAFFISLSLTCQAYADQGASNVHTPSLYWTRINSNKVFSSSFTSMSFSRFKCRGDYSNTSINRPTSEKGQMAA